MRKSGRPGNRSAQALAATHAGFKWRYLRVPHEPHALFKSDLARYFEQYPNELESLIAHRFRSGEQYLADSLGQHLAIRRGAARIQRPRRHLRLRDKDYAPARLRRHLKRLSSDESLCFLCLQGLEAVNEESRSAIFAWLSERMGEPESIIRDALSESL